MSGWVFKVWAGEALLGEALRLLATPPPEVPSFDVLLSSMALSLSNSSFKRSMSSGRKSASIIDNTAKVLMLSGVSLACATTACVKLALGLSCLFAAKSAEAELHWTSKPMGFMSSVITLLLAKVLTSGAGGRAWLRTACVPSAAWAEVLEVFRVLMATPLRDGAALVRGLLGPMTGILFMAKICWVVVAGELASASAAAASPNKALIWVASKPMAKAKSVKLFSLVSGWVTVMISTSGLRVIDCKACPS